MKLSNSESVSEYTSCIWSAEDRPSFRSSVVMSSGLASRGMKAAESLVAVAGLGSAMVYEAGCLMFRSLRVFVDPRFQWFGSEEARLKLFCVLGRGKQE